MTQFNIGDRVRVLRRVKSRENGWENSWVENMDAAVGKIGEVKGYGFGLVNNVEVDIPGIGSWGYPSFALEIVETKNKLVYRQLSDVRVGDRVLVKYDKSNHYWDGPGEVIRINPPFIMVDLDHLKNINPKGLFYLHEIEFVSHPNPVSTSEVKAKQAGIARAVAAHSTVFAKASEIAVNLAKTGVTRVVNADMVQAELAKQGYNSTDLGNAAGALFRSKNWKKFGTVKSARQGNHAREISTWEYIGA